MAILGPCNPLFYFRETRLEFGSVALVIEMTSIRQRTESVGDTGAVHRNRNVTRNFQICHFLTGRKRENCC
jgi:hypothetical protein